MTQTRVRPMVEGGLLAGIAIIFAIISAYLPVIGPFVNLLWPVPIILLGVRHGYKWSIMATVVAGIIIGMLLHPMQAVGVVVGFGLIGIVLGYAFRMEFGPAKTMLWGSVASLLSKAALLGIGFAVTGINPFAMQNDVMAKAVEQGVEVYRNLGIAEQELAKMTESMKTMIDLLKIILPAGFIMASVVDTFLNFVIARTVLKKLGHKMPDFPPFKNWTVPDYVVYFFAVALVMIYWGKTREITMMYNIGMNLQVMTSMLLLLQGLSLFYFIVDKYNLSRIVRGIILFLILSNGFFSQIVIFAGAIDTIIDYRRLRPRRKSE
ncbi:MAG: YybS family protein [Sporomusaceae bacterium]|nr:YybS family protein [Sporomusaceae bacterium]